MKRYIPLAIVTGGLLIGVPLLTAAEDFLGQLLGILVIMASVLLAIGMAFELKKQEPPSQQASSRPNTETQRTRSQGTETQPRRNENARTRGNGRGIIRSIIRAPVKIIASVGLTALLLVAWWYWPYYWWGWPGWTVVIVLLVPLALLLPVDAIIGSGRRRNGDSNTVISLIEWLGNGSAFIGGAVTAFWIALSYLYWFSLSFVEATGTWFAFWVIWTIALGLLIRNWLVQASRIETDDDEEVIIDDQED